MPYSSPEEKARCNKQHSSRRGSAEECPVAEAAYEEIISLPIFPSMVDDDVERVLTEVKKIIRGGVI